jgi:hypothetical protein
VKLKLSGFFLNNHKKYNNPANDKTDQNGCGQDAHFMTALVTLQSGE